MRKLLSFSILLVALTLGTGAPALADPGQVPSPPPGTDAFRPGKACAHANLVANRGPKRSADRPAFLGGRTRAELAGESARSDRRADPIDRCG